MRFLIIFIFIISACTTNRNRPNEELILDKSDFKHLAYWAQDDHDKALIIFKSSCEKILKNPETKKLPSDHYGAKIGKWKKACSKAVKLKPTKAAAKKFFEENFTPYKVKNKKRDTGLFTGYYEASLKGSYRHKGTFKHPVYAAPDDLDLNKAKFTRTAINNGILVGLNLELAYVEDDVELFFMHIQGSGHLHMPDGKILRLGYAAQNGYPYVAIGKHLVDHYKADPSLMSADYIKSWLRSHPKEARKVMEMNQSYVFFKKLNKEGAVGAHGVVLTPERSLAIDRKYFPLGAPFWLETTYPGGRSLNRLMIAQDTGGAIKGPVRGDVFFGHGKKAREFASGMKNRGKYFILLPK